MSIERSSGLTLSSSDLPQYNPCITSIGPKPNKVMIIGEAPGEKEEKLGIPFVGSSGQELDRMLHEAGWNPGEIYKTNVFQTRPKENKLETLFLTSQQWKQLKSSVSAAPSPPKSAQSSPTETISEVSMRVAQRLMFLSPTLHPEITRLHREIEECNPNLILALGNTALWSLTGRQNISSVRGTSLLSSTLQGSSRKVLPTFHPAAVLRQWDLRPIVLADLMKAKLQAEFPEIRRPRREILVNPTLLDLEEFLTTLGAAQENVHGKAVSALAVDVETRLGQITEIGFATSPGFAIVIPFIRNFKDHYWPTPASEATALRYVEAILHTPIPKVFQNGLYDLQYIWRTWGIAPRMVTEDTMLRHHSMYPEVNKGLGFLGSLYTDEPAWKLMRNKKSTVEKADDE